MLTRSPAGPLETRAGDQCHSLVPQCATCSHATGANWGQLSAPQLIGGNDLSFLSCCLRRLSRPYGTDQPRLKPPGPPAARLVPTSTFQPRWTCRHPPSSWGQPASPRPVSWFAGLGTGAGTCVPGHGPESVTGDRRAASPAVTEPCDPIQGSHPRGVLQEGGESSTPGLAPCRSCIRAEERRRELPTR